MIPLLHPKYKDFPVLDTYPIHGHWCVHNVFGTFDYSKLVDAVALGYIDVSAVTRAIHPYTNDNTDDWAKVYADFGVDSFPEEVYLPLTDISAAELWRIQTEEFNWGDQFNPPNDRSETVHNLLVRGRYWYTKLYTPVSSIATPEQWIAALENRSRLQL